MFELSRVNSSRWSQKSVRDTGSFEKSRVREIGGEISLSEENSGATKFGSRYREVRETEGSRNRDSTVLKLLHIHI